MPTYHLREGDLTMQRGCFTFEQHIAGMTLEEIGKELGLPPERLIRGGWIVFAVNLPWSNDFDLAGWAEFSTDNFVKDGSWNRMDFEKTYKNKRMPISIFEAKAGWLQEMNNRKLVKLVLAVPHDDSHRYPSGGKAPQIIVNRELRCQVVKYLPPGSQERFLGVWR